jgi:hypothetical protein
MVFNVTLVKELITIIMVSNEMYDVWSRMLLSWEEQLLLDGIGKLLPKPPKGVKKLSLAYLVGMMAL